MVWKYYVGSETSPVKNHNIKPWKSKQSVMIYILGSETAYFQDFVT